MKTKLEVKVLSVVAGVVLIGSSLSFAAEDAMKMDDKMMMKAGDTVQEDGKMKTIDPEIMNMSDDNKMTMPVVTAKPAMDEAMMAKMKAYSTSGENHRVLDAFVGDWTYTSKQWMTPGTPAEESSGTATAKWVMDGHFVQIDVNGTAMGQPFSGTQVIGYDNAGKEYQSVWHDNMGTGMMFNKGSYDAATKTMTQTGDFNCPLRGKIPTRWVTKIIDPTTYTFEMYSPDEKGVEFKGMEIVYKKK